MKRKFIAGFAFLALTALATTSAYCDGGPKPEPLPKAKTIKELAERYDSSSCMDCHEEIYDEWENSLHSHSLLGSPRTAPTIITAIEKGLKNFPYSGVESDEDITVEHLWMCAKCHIPQLDEATDDVAREIVATIRAWMQAYREGEMEKVEELQATIASLNISCTVCHNKMALIHKWAHGYPQATWKANTRTKNIPKWLKRRPLTSRFSAASVTAAVRTSNSPIRPSVRPCMAATCSPMSPMGAAKPARTAI